MPNPSSRAVDRDAHGEVGRVLDGREVLDDRRLRNPDDDVIDEEGARVSGGSALVRRLEVQQRRGLGRAHAEGRRDLRPAVLRDAGELSEGLEAASRAADSATARRPACPSAKRTQAVTSYVRPLSRRPSTSCPMPAPWLGAVGDQRRTARRRVRASESSIVGAPRPAVARTPAVEAVLEVGVDDDGSGLGPGAGTVVGGGDQHVVHEEGRVHAVDRSRLDVQRRRGEVGGQRVGAADLGPAVRASSGPSRRPRYTCPLRRRPSPAQ